MAAREILTCQIDDNIRRNVSALAIREGRSLSKMAEILIVEAMTSRGIGQTDREFALVKIQQLAESLKARA